MISFLIRRLAVTLVTVFGAMVFLFILIQFIPGDVASMLLGPRATPELIANMRSRMWLDRPVHLQLFRFLFNVFRGDLGVDILNQIPISTLVFRNLYHTISLAVSSILIACVIGIPLGTFAAANRNSFLDRVLGFVSISIITTPSFLMGLFLLLIFSINLGWFPVMGAGASSDFMSQLWYLVLPATALGVKWVGYIARIMRASVLEELTEDYIRTARAKGLSERIVVYKYALKAALIPIISVIGVGFGNLLGGAVLIEITFSRPGIGFLIFNAIQSRNYPVVQGGFIVAVFLYAFVNMIADLSYGLVDPRVRG